MFSFWFILQKQVLLMPKMQGEHTIYSRNNMRQKCGGNCGLWVLHEIVKNIYPEDLKKIVGALWELPAK